MTANNDNIKALLATSTPTGVLDHAAIESRARQLRSEMIRALVQRLLRAWATTVRREDNARASDCSRLRGDSVCHC